MLEQPSRAAIVQKIIEVVKDSVDRDEDIDPTAPLGAGLDFDSLDLIETSFSLQETFDFEFAEKNPIEALDEALGGEKIVVEGKLTDLGRDMVLQRMPELKTMDLPATLTPNELQKYYSVETFARLIEDFYRAAPTTDPASGEAVVVRDFKVQTESGNAVDLPSGDALVDAWVAETAERLRQQL